MQTDLARRIRALALFCLLSVPSLMSAGLLAQDSRPTPAATLARGPFVSLSLAGPKALRQAILPSNLGAMFSSAEGLALWVASKQAIDEVVTHAESDAAVQSWKKLSQQLLRFAGRIELEIHVSRAADARKRARYQAMGCVVIWSDGRSDLTALREELCRFAIAVSGREPLQATFGDDLTFEYYGRPGDEGISLPVPHENDHLVVFFGSRIEAAITVGLARLRRSWPERCKLVETRMQTPGDLLALQFDMKQVAIVMDDEIGKTTDSMRGMMNRVFGTATWDVAGCSVRTAGPHLQFELVADCEKGKRGIFAGFLPDMSKLPATVRLAPTGSPEQPPAFVAGHFRADEMLTALVDFAANFALFHSNPRTHAEVKAEMNKEAGFDIEKDFVAHLGTEALVLADLSECEAEPGVRPHDLDGICLGIRVANEKAFARTYATWVAREGKGEPEKIGGADVVQIKLGNRGECIAFHKGHVYWALGPRGRNALVAHLTRAAPEDPGDGLPRALRRVRRLAPAGLNLGGVVPLRILQDPLAKSIVWDLWREFRGGFPARVRREMTREKLEETIGRALPILTKYRLDRLHVLGGYENLQHKNRFRLRFLW